MNNSPNIFLIEHLNKIIQSSHDAFIISDSGMKIIYSNLTAQNIFGYTEEGMIGMSLQMLMPPERRRNYLFDMQSALEGKVVSNIKNKTGLFGQRKNSEVFPIELTYLTYPADGQNFFVSQIRDITEQKNSEYELESTTTALKIITEANRLLVNSTDEVEYLNNICKIITSAGRFPRALILILKDRGENDILIERIAYSGYSSIIPDSNYLLSSVNFESLTAIAIREKKTNICADIIGRDLWKYWVDDPEKMEFESTIAIPMFINDKCEFVLRVFSSDPIFFSDEKVTLLEELSKDIAQGIIFIRTKLAHSIALKNLEESENKYRALFQSNNDAIFIADAETGIIIDANEKAEDMIELPVEEIIGMHHLDLHPDGYQEKYNNIFMKQLKLENYVSDEFYVKTKSSKGKAIPVQISANIVFINGKKVIQGIFRDISKSKMEEEKIRTTQKMEALGTMSGGIAHDINNILSPIIGFTQLAVLDYENKEKQNSYLNEVLTAANRAKELVSQILTFCRKSETEKKPHNVQSILKEVIKLISVSLPKNVELQSIIDDNCEPIMCDPVQIYQIVINLCTNAYQAMKDNGGVLRVCLVRKGSSEIKSDNSEVLQFDDFICLIVSDTGCGMSKTTLNRIFEPYFTTKPKEEGTGLGLSVVSGIVKEHGGDIYVRTYPNEGTYFKITFPIVASALERNDVKENIISRKNEIKVLVVDDEPQITFMLKHMLEELGYSCETFNDPVTSLDRFISDPTEFDFVITDQTMPKLLGTELSKKILEIKPGMPIILNTGYSPVASKSEAKKIGIKEFMMKPITISELSMAIERALKN